mmetsp:Transcript_26860/g.91690  ORF Transcript_26860/g.91690 Transcript_26860/m.91690 type:complete len:271 (+) Transcript_26860:177-989(+)
MERVLDTLIKACKQDGYTPVIHFVSEGCIRGTLNTIVKNAVSKVLPQCHVISVLASTAHSNHLENRTQHVQCAVDSHGWLQGILRCTTTEDACSIDLASIVKQISVKRGTSYVGKEKYNGYGLIVDGLEHLEAVHGKLRVQHELIAKMSNSKDFQFIWCCHRQNQSSCSSLLDRFSANDMILIAGKSNDGVPAYKYMKYGQEERRCHASMVWQAYHPCNNDATFMQFLGSQRELTNLPVAVSQEASFALQVNSMERLQRACVVLPFEYAS